MRYAFPTLLAAMLLAGCSSKLAYRPEESSSRVPVTAVHYTDAERFYVYVNSQGIPVDAAVLVRGDGQQVAPLAVHRPAVSVDEKKKAKKAKEKEAELSIEGTPPKRRGDMSQTIVIFQLAKIGEGPWRFRVKLEGYPDATIHLPPFASAK